MNNFEKLLLSSFKQKIIDTSQKEKELLEIQEPLRKEAYLAVHRFLMELSKTLLLDGSASYFFIYKNTEFWFKQKDGQHSYSLQSKGSGYFSKVINTLNESDDKDESINLMNISNFLSLFSDYKEFLDFVNDEVTRTMVNRLSALENTNKKLLDIKNAIGLG